MENQLKPALTYKGVDIFTYQNVYDKSKGSRKVHLYFDLNGTRYKNGAVLEAGTDIPHFDKEVERLLDWARTVINENKS